MMGLSALDWLIVLVVLFSTLQALSEGFFHEFFALAGVIIGYLIAAWEYPRAGSWYAHYVNSQWTAEIAGFFTIFFIVLLLAGLLGRLARWAVKGIGLRWFDRILGAAFGFIRGVALSAVIVLALAAFAPQWGLPRSRFAPMLLTTSRGLIWAAPAELRQRFWTGWDLLKAAPQHLPLEPHSNTERPRSPTTQ
jgi:membrane protein required for colicin V production